MPVMKGPGEPWARHFPVSDLAPTSQGDSEGWTISLPNILQAYHNQLLLGATRLATLSASPLVLIHLVP